jgi:hypothetical protein
MIMCVAVGIHGSNLDRANETYNLMSERYFTYASPILFNAGTPHPQLSSCFLVCTKDDSIEGIYNTFKVRKFSKFSNSPRIDQFSTVLLVTVCPGLSQHRVCSSSLPAPTSATATVSSVGPRSPVFTAPPLQRLNVIM